MPFTESQFETHRARLPNVSFACAASLRSYVTPKHLTAGVAIPYQLHLLFLFKGVLGETTMRGAYDITTRPNTHQGLVVETDLTEYWKEIDGK